MANMTAMMAAKKAKLNEFQARPTKSQPRGSASNTAQNKSCVAGIIKPNIKGDKQITQAIIALLPDKGIKSARARDSAAEW